MGRRRSLAAGALAAGSALAALWAAAASAPSLRFPPLSLADRIVRLTPGDMATTAIERLGHDAQRLLAVASAGAMLLEGALLALLAARGRRGTVLAAGLLAASALAADLADPVPLSLGRNAAVCALAGVAFAGALIGWRRVLAPSRGAALAAVSAARNVPVDPGRRRALGVLALATAGTWAGAAGAGRLLAGGDRVSVVEALAPRAPHRPPFPRIPGLLPEVTPVDEHYVVDIDLNDPLVDPDTWRLKVGGNVQNPLELSFDELQERFGLVEEHSVLTCISNRVGGPLVGNSRWEGVPLGTLLGAVRPAPGAWGLAVGCADGYTAGIPLATAMQPSSLVAIAQDGQPLTRQHGFPCRLRIPALYGMLNPKWVTSIDVVDRPFRGYWAKQGWSPTAVVHTQSRIDTPKRARVGEPTWIAGVAWAGIRSISRVEVSTDGGATWTAAPLHRPLSPWAWTQWAHHWTPAHAGRAQLVCRAVDGRGIAQAANPSPPHPAGATGYHRVDVEVSAAA